MALVAAAALQSIAGCSLIFVRKAPPLPVEPAPEVECTRSATAPAVDMILATGATVAGLVGITTSSCHTGGSWGATAPGDCLFDASGVAHGVGAGALVLSALLAVSSVHGFVATAHCRDIATRQEACRDGDEAACARLVPPPPSKAPDAAAPR